MGRAALVVGAAGGIGSAIAVSLRGAGFAVHGFDRTRPADADVRCVVGDVLAPGALEAAVADAERAEGAVRAAVYGAGVVRDAVVWKLTDAAWDEVLAVNLTGAFRCVRAAAPALRRAGGGAIVLIGSINGERGKFGQANYAASKAGLIGLAKSAARELGRFGVRVNVVEPGITDTAMMRALPEEARDAAVGETLLGRAAAPSDVAEAVRFLCTDAGRHVTGQVLRVDGGQLL